ncbi:hypothetical protein [uncultured Aliiroseovarius sp.]|uniref:hypothetical protein n=1 Tax=uncultured Aliiroseovarius sp. TaxID=1658783 RepID=UPI00262B0D07|nr:hypothetical protein [uncultured Aliiroseovarius sp.]
MKRNELQAEFDRLSFQIGSVRDQIGKAPDELTALASQQVCVSLCGSLEQSLKRIFVGYARARSDNRIFRPIEKACESYQNPKTTKILELVGLFDAEFERDLRQFWDSEGEIERDHLNNLVDDRIVIAHRKRPHVNVSTGKLTNYYKAYEGLLERVFDHFLT